MYVCMYICINLNKYELEEMLVLDLVLLLISVLIVKLFTIFFYE